MLDFDCIEATAFAPGTVNAATGAASYAYIQAAIDAALAGDVAAVTTGPISKEALHAAGHRYHSLSVQPVIVLAADRPTLATIHRRALDRDAPHALYIEEMFATGHDAANRAAFAQFAPETAKVVGLALRGERKLVDKITRGARMHP